MKNDYYLVNKQSTKYLCEMKLFLKKNPLISLFLFMMPGFAAAIIFSVAYNKIEPLQLTNFLNSFGYGAALIFIALFTVRTFLVFAPYYVLLVIGGTLFGRKYGLIYNFAAVFLSCTLAFILSRLLQPTIWKRFQFAKYTRFVNLIEIHGFKILLFMRLTIIFPFDILNYAAGIAGMRYRTFILANMIGVLPEVFFLTLFGHSLHAPKSLQFIILSVILCIALILGIRYKDTLNNWIRSVK